MTEKVDLIEDFNARKEAMENCVRNIEVLESVKEILTLGNTEFVTTQMASDYFEVGLEAINSLIKDNKEELVGNGLRLYKRKEIREEFLNLQDVNIQIGRGKDVITIDGIQFNVTNTGIYLISKRVLLSIGMLLRDSEVARKLRNEIFGIKKVAHERKEIKFLDQLEQTLEPFGIKGKRQYSVLSYRIDYYIPSLNIAIEYDENDHDSYTYEQHEGRQEDIENELGCRFIRVSDNNSNEWNIGYVIKNIFNIK